MCGLGVGAADKIVVLHLPLVVRFQQNLVQQQPFHIAAAYLQLATWGCVAVSPEFLLHCQCLVQLGARDRFLFNQEFAEARGLCAVWRW